MNTKTSIAVFLEKISRFFLRCVSGLIKLLFDKFDNGRFILNLIIELFKRFAGNAESDVAAFVCLVPGFPTFKSSRATLAVSAGFDLAILGAPLTTFEAVIKTGPGIGAKYLSKIFSNWFSESTAAKLANT